ncbi:hypothetical protein FQZ97_981160 [compost metagenome]
MLGDTSTSPPWLHLLVLDDGCEIQQCGERSTAEVEEEARLCYGDTLLTVVAVPGFERPLAKAEIAEALAGTLRIPEPVAPSVTLARVARFLGVRPAYLMEGGYFTPCDLAHLAGADAEWVAKAIRCSELWLNRLQRSELQTERTTGEPPEGEPQRVVHAAATPSPAWREAEKAYINHRMACRICRAPAGLHCAVGNDLRQRYEQTPVEPEQ